MQGASSVRRFAVGSILLRGMAITMCLFNVSLVGGGVALLPQESHTVLWYSGQSRRGSWGGELVLRLAGGGKGRWGGTAKRGKESFKHADVAGELDMVGGVGAGGEVRKRRKRGGAKVRAGKERGELAWWEGLSDEAKKEFMEREANIEKIISIARENEKAAVPPLSEDERQEAIRRFLTREDDDDAGAPSKRTAPLFMRRHSLLKKRAVAARMQSVWRQRRSGTCFEVSAARRRGYLIPSAVNDQRMNVSAVLAAHAPDRDVNPKSAPDRDDAVNEVEAEMVLEEESKTDGNLSECVAYASSWRGSTGRKSLFLQAGDYDLGRDWASPCEVDACGVLNLVGEKGARVWGGLMLRDESRGNFTGVAFIHQALGDDVFQLEVTEQPGLHDEALFHVHGGPWRWEGCALRSVLGDALSASEWARCLAQECQIGGLGGDSLNAMNGLLARGRSRVEASKCVFEYTGSMAGACIACQDRCHVNISGTGIKTSGYGVSLKDSSRVQLSCCSMRDVEFCLVARGGAKASLLVNNTILGGDSIWDEDERPMTLNMTNPKGACKDFLRGDCSRKNKCKFPHTLALVGVHSVDEKRDTKVGVDKGGMKSGKKAELVRREPKITSSRV